MLGAQEGFKYKLFFQRVDVLETESTKACAGHAMTFDKALP